MSEALIFESFNPQYDERLFIESPEKYKFRTCCVQILFWISKQKKNNFCTQHVAKLYFSWNSMNNLSSYCGLIYSGVRASDTDLPVFSYRLHFVSIKTKFSNDFSPVHSYFVTSYFALTKMKTSLLIQVPEVDISVGIMQTNTINKKANYKNLSNSKVS